MIPGNRISNNSSATPNRIYVHEWLNISMMLNYAIFHILNSEMLKIYHIHNRLFSRTRCLCRFSAHTISVNSLQYLVSTNNALSQLLFLKTFEMLRLNRTCWNWDQHYEWILFLWDYTNKNHIIFLVVLLEELQKFNWEAILHYNA